MAGSVEIDFVVSDCLQALALYEKIFETQRIEVTSVEKGGNEAVFTMYGARFHIFDENPAMGMVAPQEGVVGSTWMNITVADLKAVYDKAIAAGCTAILPPNHMEAFGVTNSVFKDAFGHVWMLHQVHRVVSFEERCKILEAMRAGSQ